MSMVNDDDLDDVDENVTFDTAIEDLKEARRLYEFARSYDDQCKYAEAKRAYQSALTIGEKSSISKKHPEQQLAIRIESTVKNAVQFYGSNDPDVATHLCHIAEAMRKDDDASRLIERTIEIDKKFLGTDHPDAARRLNILASIYKAEGMYGHAAYYYQRALEIYTNWYGPDYPDVATAESNLISLLKALTKEQAKALYEILLYGDHTKRDRIRSVRTLLGENEGKQSLALEFLPNSPLLLTLLSSLGLYKKRKFSADLWQNQNNKSKSAIDPLGALDFDDLAVSEDWSGLGNHSKRRRIFPTLGPWPEGKIAEHLKKGEIKNGQWYLAAYEQACDILSAEFTLKMLKKNIQQKFKGGLNRFFVYSEDDNVYIFFKIHFSKNRRLRVDNQFDILKDGKLIQAHMFAFEGYPHPASIEWDIEKMKPLKKWQSIDRRDRKPATPPEAEGKPVLLPLSDHNVARQACPEILPPMVNNGDTCTLSALNGVGVHANKPRPFVDSAGSDGCLSDICDWDVFELLLDESVELVNRDSKLVNSAKNLC